MNPTNLHAWVYERTGGRIGGRLGNVPVALLRTTGRKTGQPRTAPLVYAKDGADYLFVASNNGSDRPPGWLFNIEARPAVELQAGRARTAGAARVVRPDDPGYPRLWQAVNDNNHGRYDRYQAKTSRGIPVVVVTPVSTPAPG